MKIFSISISFVIDFLAKDWSNSYLFLPTEMVHPILES